MFKIILYAQAYETRCRPVEERQEEEDEEVWHTIQPRGDFFRLDPKTATLKIQG